MRFRVLMGVAAVFALFVVSGPVQADWVDNFDGGLQQTWHSDHVTAGADSPTFTFASENNKLEVYDTTAVASGGAASGYGLVEESFLTVVVDAVIQPTVGVALHQHVGLLARMHPINVTGYAFTLDYYNDSGEIALSKINSSTSSDTLVTGTLDGFESSDSVYMRFLARGSRLVGAVYEEEGGLKLGEIDWEDTTYTAGWAGVVDTVIPANDQNPVEYGIPLRASFDVVSATIPEPGSVAMLISGCLCAAGLVWRRRRQK